MKKTLLPILLFLFCTQMMAQNDNYDIEMAKKEKKWMAEVEALATNFKKKITDETPFWQTFMLDTFRIERYLSIRMESDYSTQGMNQAMYEAEKRYDKLLNKYYKMLLDKLQGEDKKVLTETQKSWILFKEKEYKLMGTVYSVTYTGGGTMYSNILAGRKLEITKQRAIELAVYLSE
ncbi:MAG: DUF1311 domain-containing protein [Saprospiraceae bacterium]|nr:DUF1311 domain-containing protein [Saprospiraceae bacterium]